MLHQMAKNGLTITPLIAHQWVRQSGSMRVGVVYSRKERFKGSRRYIHKNISIGSSYCVLNSFFTELIQNHAIFSLKTKKSKRQFFIPELYIRV